MHLSHILQNSIPNRNVHISVLNNVLLKMELVHTDLLLYVLWDVGLLPHIMTVGHPSMP